MIYLTVLLLGVSIQWNLLSMLGRVAGRDAGSAIFATFSLIIACLVKSRERFMGIGQFMTMPLFFASNAIYPLALMPRWLRVVALVEPADLSGGCAARVDDWARPDSARPAAEFRGRSRSYLRY